MMQFSLLAVILTAFASQITCSPLLPLPPPAAKPTCTINVFRHPAFEQKCSFMQSTTTTTVYTECGGCALKTKALGLGLPCQVMTTVPGVATKTVKACKTSKNYMPVVTPPVMPCEDEGVR